MSNRSIAHLETGVEWTPRADAEIADWRTWSAPTPVAAFGYWALPFVVGRSRATFPAYTQEMSREMTRGETGSPELGRGASTESA